MERSEVLKWEALQAKQRGGGGMCTILKVDKFQTFTRDQILLFY